MEINTSKILITGNLGYIGPAVINHFKKKYSSVNLIGFDYGYFTNCSTEPFVLPDIFINEQYFGDIRNFPENILEGVDYIIHLAAISNDPMGNKFEEVTYQINYKATIELARKAKNAGVKGFVFASSCSVYGFAEQGITSEQSTVNPLTAYAKSKVMSENDLMKLADSNFKISCLRFATACGFSSRLRLDLVLNDFVTSALVHNRIDILSDGAPWRPLINIKDMARAMDWALNRDKEILGNFLVINAGSNWGNYQVKDLAVEIQKNLANTEININKNAQPDKRSYKVDFDMFQKHAQGYLPVYDLKKTIEELILGINQNPTIDKNFRTSKYMRLNVLNFLIEKKLLGDDLKWNILK